ncbi:signaling mucin HKR1-like [Leptopilina heterotoma]|uniref:signaling mucin HKR1-like n=1 Tax=Leptopilina heterotoma TaxID=63436 RepID=UPI001CA8CCEB|nr:signaling mucin HKR1-like [Leptopilina heterotoma]
MKILIFCLLGIVLVGELVFAKSLVEKKEIKIDKLIKRDTKTELSAKSEEEKKLDFDLEKDLGKDLEKVEREKKSCQVIRGPTTRPMKICMEFNRPTPTLYVCDDNGYPYGLLGQRDDNSSPNNYLTSPTSYLTSPSNYLTSPSSSPFYLNPSIYDPSGSSPSNSPYPSSSPNSYDPSSLYPSSLYDPSSPYGSGNLYGTQPTTLQYPGTNPSNYGTNPNQQIYSLPYYTTNPSNPDYNSGNYVIRSPYDPENYPNSGAERTWPYSMIRQCHCKLTPISGRYPYYIGSTFGRSNQPTESTVTPTEALNIVPTVAASLPSEAVAVESSPTLEAENPSSQASSARTAINLQPIAPTYRLITSKPAVVGLAPVYRVATNFGDSSAATTNIAATQLPRSGGGGIIIKPLEISAAISTPQISRQYIQPQQQQTQQEQMRALNNFPQGLIQGPRYYRTLDELNSDNEAIQNSSQLISNSSQMPVKNQQKRSQDGKGIGEKQSDVMKKQQ